MRIPSKDLNLKELPKFLLQL